MRKTCSLLLLLFLISLLPLSALAQEEIPLDDMRLSIGQSRDFFIKVRNPITEGDIISTEFRGGAMNLINIDIIESHQEVEDLDECEFDTETDELCCNKNLDCRLKLGPGEDFKISYTAKPSSSGDISGLHQGQAELISEAVSETTHLDDMDSVTVMVDPVSIDGEVVESTGLTTPFLIFLFLSGVVFYMFYKV